MRPLSYDRRSTPNLLFYALHNADSSSAGLDPFGVFPPAVLITGSSKYQFQAYEWLITPSVVEACIVFWGTNIWRRSLDHVVIPDSHLAQIVIKDNSSIPAILMFF